MTLGLNREGTRQKYTYQKRLTNRSRKVGVDYALEFIYLNSPPVEKQWGKKNGTK